MENYPKKSIWKWVLAAFMVAILLSILFTLYWGYKKGAFSDDQTNPNVQNQSQVNDETTDWKTYRNDEYGFEIQYSANTQIKNEEKNTSFIFSDNQRQLNIETITGAESNECHKTAWAADLPSISLDGVIFEGIGCGGKCEPYDKIQYCAIHNGIAYKLFPQIVHVQGYNSLQEDNIFNQMLSTFKFSN